MVLLLYRYLDVETDRFVPQKAIAFRKCQNKGMNRGLNPKIYSFGVDFSLQERWALPHVEETHS